MAPGGRLWREGPIGYCGGEAGQGFKFSQILKTPKPNTEKLKQNHKQISEVMAQLPRGLELIMAARVSPVP